MKKSILITVLFALALGACRSLRVRDFHTDAAISQRLPPLGLLVHERSFEDAFFAALDRDVILTNMTTGPYLPSPWEVYEKTEHSLSDVFQVMENELRDNINQQGGDRYGDARFKLRYYQRRNSGWGWFIPSVATFWTANLLGMPFYVLRVDVELQMEITDANGKVLSHYTASGTGKGKVAAYHGYDGHTAIRKANLVAIQDAISKMKTSMTPDIPALTEQLKEAGVMHPLDRK